MKSKRIFNLVSIVFAILFIPWFAMQFTNEVKWTVMDFILAGVLLLGAGLFIEVILQNVSSKKTRILLFVILILLFMLLWLEMAVGILGTPLAGS